MLIADILRRKGGEVATVTTGSTVGEVIALLAERRIGALPVTDDGRSIDGIVSERDIVRALAAGTPDLSARAVRELMTTPVYTCRREATLQQVMALMTERRIRHVPVVDDHDSLAGILSIGDLINARLEEAEAERQRMADYIADVPG